MQSLDLAEYNFLFALSFTTPTFDSEVAPSFGTLLATVNVALNMLGEVSWGLSDSGLSASSLPPGLLRPDSGLEHVISPPEPVLFPNECDRVSPRGLS